MADYNLIWGCNGFDGDTEAKAASSGGNHLNSLNFKIKS